MVDGIDFLLNSDYPLDKVILLHSDYINFAVSGLDYVYSHSLSFVPLVKAVWSTDSSFSVTYNIGDGPVSSNPSFPFLPQLVGAFANSSDVTLQFGNPGAVPGAYIRIYALMPSDVNDDVGETSSSADEFVLNTDYNYTKLYLEGISSSSSTPSSTATVAHDLGYYPQVEVWFEKSGVIYALSSTLIIATPFSESAEITTSDLIMTRAPFLSTPEKFHYRIYLDELS